MPLAKDPKMHMPGSSKNRDSKKPAPASRVSQTRMMNHLKDEVYRQMLFLEMNRSGSEMGLALALLRAVVQFESAGDQANFGEWLRTVCPLGLNMIDASLRTGCKYNSSVRRKVKDPA